MFTPSSKSASGSNLETYAFRLARVFCIVLVNKELNLNFETQWIMLGYVLAFGMVSLGVILAALTIWAFHGCICVLGVYLLFPTGVCVIVAVAKQVVVWKLSKIVDDHWQASWGFESKPMMNWLSVAGTRWLWENVSPGLFWCASDQFLVAKCTTIKV